MFQACYSFAVLPHCIASKLKTSHYLCIFKQKEKRCFNITLLTVVYKLEIGRPVDSICE